MYNVDPEVHGHDLTEEEDDVEVQMPSPEDRHYLLQLYFTYVHPFFPVIHKQDFLYHYNALYVLSPDAYVPRSRLTVTQRVRTFLHPMSTSVIVILTRLNCQNTLGRSACRCADTIEGAPYATAL